LLDGWFYEHLRVEGIYEKDWGRALRVMGFVPLWWVGALALWMQERPERTRRPLMLVLSPGVSGLAAEVLKVMLRRERPGAHAGEYFFRSFAERTFSSGGLALPSSHAAVAFGAAAILSRLYPRARIIWWSVAWGCGLSRVAAGAHFLSDVVLAAVVGWLAGAVVWKVRPAKGAAEGVLRPGVREALHEHEGRSFP
jgi:membrane-associated phospholipid phosphatase